MSSSRGGPKAPALSREQIEHVLQKVVQLQKSGHPNPVSTVAKENALQPSSISKWRKKSAETGRDSYLASKRYPAEFRKKIVQEYHEVAKTRPRGAQVFLSNKYGVNMTTIRRWIIAHAATTLKDTHDK